MHRSGWWILGLGLVVMAQFGCNHFKEKRVTRQPVVEEYNLPPDDSKVADGPYYPEQKRQLPVQIREQEKSNGMAGKAGGGMGGPGGPISGGGGSPSGLNGNGSPVR